MHTRRTPVIMNFMTTKSLRALMLAGLTGFAAAGFTGTALSDSSGTATASEGSATGEAPQAMQALQAKRQEIRQLSQKLRQIQQKATEANPELQADQQEYRDLVVDAMSSEGYDPQAEVERIRKLQAELQSGGGDMAQDERQAKTQELKQKSQQFRRKQQQAMQNKDVQNARKDLDEKMKAAMNEQNPEAGEILAQLNELQQEYQNLLQKAIQQQQQGGGGTGQGDQG